MSRIAFLQDLLSSVFVRQDEGDRLGNDNSLTELCDDLLSERGEMSGNRIARTLLARLEQADDKEARAFFDLLLSRFDLNAQHAVRAAERYAADNSVEHLSILMNSVEPRRQELFRRLNRVDGATGQIVRLRARLLQMQQGNDAYQRIDLDFQHLFRSWFNRGFLVLREIDWRTPANILEKIIEYEAVHAINSWAALRSRLEPLDRKCFAFFHPAMLDEPLIFVEVALTRSDPATVREVLDLERQVLPVTDLDTAVFYSISNCQKGLAGVSFGNFLIKQVASELSAQLPNLKTFRTLSPIPGFMRWVKTADPLELDEELKEGRQLALAIAAGGESDEPAGQSVLLQRLAAHYLAVVKRSDDQPLDPVARFHLGNGASLDQVLPGADLFEKGLSQSAGAMVSYLYDLEQVEQNHEAYAGEREVILSSGVKALLAASKRSRRRTG